MGILVHCPNPACARVHRVKDRFAGMRGKCPKCSSWMYVPIPVIAGMDNMEDMGKSMLLDNEEPPSQPTPPKKTPVLAHDDPPVVEPVDESPAYAPGKPKFNRLAACLMFLGLLGLALLAASPYLEPPTIEATGNLANDLRGALPRGIEPAHSWIVTGAGAAGVILILLSLLTYRLSLISRFLLYLSVIASACLLFLALSILRMSTTQLNQLRNSIDQRQAAGMTGEATATLGQQLYAATGGTAAACVFLLLAAVVLHRRWWSRLIGFVFLGFVVALVPAWVYREELGINGYFPPEIEEFFRY